MKLVVRHPTLFRAMDRVRIVMPLIVAGILISATFMGWGVISSQSGQSEFSGQNAYDQIERLTEFGPRTTGSAEIVVAGNYILDYLQNLGWDVKDEWYTLDFDGPLLVPARNLIASYGEGSAIIIGGHYDTRVFTDQDLDPNLGQERAIGANDNGSGTGVILELARVITEHYEPQQEIRLVFFDAEDNPGIPPWRSVMGSTLYVENLEDDNIELAIILDMVGDMEQFIPIESNSYTSAPAIVDGIWSTAAGLGYDAFITREVSPNRSVYAFTDDHMPFIRAGIPAVLLLDIDYPYWHTTLDTIDKISVESLERVGHTLITFLVQKGVLDPK